jgi:hypothetical protein
MSKRDAKKVKMAEHLEKVKVKALWDSSAKNQLLSFQERIQLALQFDEANYQHSAIVSNLGVSRTALTHAINNKANGGSGEVVRGAPTKMSQAVAEAVHARLTTMSMNLRSCYLDAGNRTHTMDFTKLCMEEIKKTKTNEINELKYPCSQTVNVWRVQVDGLVRAANKKPKSRLAAFENMRTSVSMAAGIWALFKRMALSYELLFTTDDVAFMIHSMTDNSTKVVTTQEAAERLDEEQCYWRVDY